MHEFQRYYSAAILDQSTHASYIARRPTYLHDCSAAAQRASRHDTTRKRQRRAQRVLSKYLKGTFVARYKISRITTYRLRIQLRHETRFSLLTNIAVKSNCIGFHARKWHVLYLTRARSSFNEKSHKGSGKAHFPRQKSY